ncbi:MAG: shikimate kinase [Lacisediminihabitans sp.]
MGSQESILTPLVLIGAPGAGKTRLGKRVAHLLRVPFIDTYKAIVAVHGPIAQIFEEYGEAYFRRLEREAVVDALRTSAVVALGGGAILDPHTQEDLRGIRVAQLTVSAEAVRSRIGGGKRPLVKGGIDDWIRLVDSRKATYDSLARHTWDTSFRPLDDIAAEVADWVRHDSVTPTAAPKELTQ